MRHSILFFLMFLLVVGAATATAPEATEVGIVTEDDNLYEDSNIFGYCNYTSADNNLQDGGEWKLWYQKDGVWDWVGGNLTQTGLWSFDGSADSRDGKIPFQNVEPGYSAGRYGQAYNKSNSTQALSYMMEGKLNNSVGSVAFWYRLNENESQLNPYSRLFEIYMTNQTSYNGSVYKLWQDGLRWTGNTNKIGDKSDYLQENAPLITEYAGDWHHFAITWNNVSNSSNVYFDGLIDDEMKGQAWYLGTNNTMNQLFIGIASSLGADGNASFDDLVIYKHELSNVEIKSLYQLTKPVHPNMQYINTTLIGLNIGDNITFQCTVKDNTSSLSSPANSTKTKVSMRQASITTNFTKTVGIINTKNSIALPTVKWVADNLLNNATLRNNLKTLKPEWIRINLDNSTYGTTEIIPYMADGTYDYTNLSKMINITLQLGSKPFICFHEAPSAIANSTSAAYPPNEINRTIFVAYVKNTTKYYYDMCSNGTFLTDYGTSCDATQWRWEIWNEPEETTASAWWSSSRMIYVELYNESTKAIHQVNPNLKVCGYTWNIGYGKDFTPNNYANFLRFINKSTTLDCISVHTYGQMSGRTYGYPDIWLFDKNEYIYYNTTNSIRNVLNEYGHTNAEMFLTEYNWNSGNIDPAGTIRSGKQAAWTATTITNLLKSNYTGIFFFAALDLFGSNAQAFGLFNTTGNQNPDEIGQTFRVVQHFSQYFTNGSNIIETITNDGINTFAIKKSHTHNSVEITNQHNASVNVSVNVGANVKWTDANNSAFSMNSTNGMMNYTLSPYQVLFLVNNYSMSTHVSSPANNSVLSGSTATLTIDYNSTNTVTTCQYSLDSGANTTFTCTGDTITGLSTGTHTMTVWLTDNLGGTSSAASTWTTNSIITESCTYQFGSIQNIMLGGVLGLAVGIALIFYFGRGLLEGDMSEIPLTAITVMLLTFVGLIVFIAIGAMMISSMLGGC